MGQRTYGPRRVHGFRDVGAGCSFSNRRRGFKGVHRVRRLRHFRVQAPSGRILTLSDGTHIEWTDATWNPVTGCSRISPGCVHCYAERFAERFRGVKGHPYEQGFDLKLWPKRLELPLGWKDSRRIFVNSMSDLFHERVPTAYVKKVFATMNRADWHFFQVLTKRAPRLSEIAPLLRWTPNIWQGVSVERADFKWRIDELRKVPASVRFLSLEPLLGDLGDLDLEGIHWVIAGGESGPGARPMEAKWVRGIRRECRRQHVPFFFKQWGGVQKHKTGRLLDGRTYDEYPAPQPVTKAVVSA